MIVSIPDICFLPYFLRLKSIKAILNDARFTDGNILNLSLVGQCLMAGTNVAQLLF